MIALGWLVACNRYELFLVSGHEQRELRNAADVLFVIDNSDSMVEESVALAENFGSFIQRLVGLDEEYGTNGLPDAVDRYVDEVRDPALFVDFQLAITTTDAGGDKGRLLGDVEVMRRGELDVETAFIATLMCEATCFPNRGAIPSDPGHDCDDGFTGQVTQEFLDCTCGADAWVDNCGAGAEEGLESVFNAVCRAMDEPLPDCWEDTTLSANQAGSNAGLLRRNTTFIPVIVTDEGDSSHRTPNVEANPRQYAELFRDTEVYMAWAAIAPGLDEDLEVACPGLAQSWGVLRYDYFVQATGGLRVDIHDPDCGPGDFGEALDRLGELIGGRINAFPLPKEPVVESITVEVGKRSVDPAEPAGNDVFGFPVYTEGWSYRAEDNTVLLHGEAIPDFEEDVAIYFWPAARAE
jgi:hypothetical protein